MNKRGSMSRLETAKTWAEIMAIAIGAIVAGIFVFRNWEYPSAQLEVVGVRRAAASDGRDHLLVDLRFEVGQAGCRWSPPYEVEGG